MLLTEKDKAWQDFLKWMTNTSTQWAQRQILYQSFADINHDFCDAKLIE